ALLRAVIQTGPVTPFSPGGSAPGHRAGGEGANQPFDLFQTADISSTPSPRTFGDFRILREVGRGGMGVVYEAEQISLNRRVALKVLPFAAALDAKQLQRFRQEAHAAACLHHTGIVPVYAVGCERGVHFYAMQFIDGHDLAAVIRELRQNVECRMTNDERMTNDQSQSTKEPVAGANAQTQFRHSTLDLLSS